jgi:hypothetical protein
VLELPEVEVLRKDLEKEVVGKRVKDVVVETPSIVRSFHRNRPDFVKALEGRKVEAVRRRDARFSSTSTKAIRGCLIRVTQGRCIAKPRALSRLTAHTSS